MSIAKFVQAFLRSVQMKDTYVIMIIIDSEQVFVETQRLSEFFLVNKRYFP